MLANDPRAGLLSVVDTVVSRLTTEELSALSLRLIQGMNPLEGLGGEKLQLLLTRGRMHDATLEILKTVVAEKIRLIAA